ncbi:MAG: penicillin-binding protein 1C [Rhodobacteraceae bacterium]|nr:penicillin-binding protein 1C [Paracoccaceae bacterium]
MVVALFAAALGAGLFDAWVKRTDLPVTVTDSSVEIRDRDGQLLRAYPVADGIMRLAVTPDQVDPLYLSMLFRYEDKRFHRHSGVDPVALIRATVQSLRTGEVVSGGSTLSMQVARLLEDGTTGRWAGKLRQMRVAWALERRLTKSDILTLYLTHAPFGGNLEGVRSASFAWFGKEPRRLTPAQSALLVALPQSPERRRPDRATDRARSARDMVLTRMVDQGILDVTDGLAAITEPVPTRMKAFPRHAAHLTDRMRARHPDAQSLHLTVRADLQMGMEQLARRVAQQAGRRISTAIVVADIETGDVLASVGSAGFTDESRLGFVDMTRAVRSPGSTLKPLVYGLAFDQGLVHPETLIHDGPVDFDGYAPQNFDGTFRGDLRVREGLQMSLNIPVVKLTNELGATRLMDALKRAGAEPSLSGGQPGLAISLGGIGTTLEGLVQLYLGIASGGQGPVLRRIAGAPTSLQDRLMSPVAAWYLGDILRGVTPPAGGRRGVVAYKTGTSYGHRDTWAIGWDGQHVIGVWMGRADGTPVPGVFGGELAAPVLFEAFGRVKPDPAPLAPPPPDALILGVAELPQPLQRFRPRHAAFTATADAPQMLFPPDGARLAAQDAQITVKLRGGKAPFLVLSDGVPILSRQYQREFDVPIIGRGFATLVVVDGEGLSDRAQIRID